jgi:hypothetical protein
MTYLHMKVVCRFGYRFSQMKFISKDTHNLGKPVSVMLCLSAVIGSLFLSIFPWHEIQYLDQVRMICHEMRPAFSQKVWTKTFGGIPLVGKNGETNGYCFPVWSQTMSTLLHKSGEFGRGTGWGAHEPPGTRKWAGVCSFKGETEGGKTFLLMWLSCPPLPDFSCPTLASLSLIGFCLSRVMSHRSLHFAKCLCESGEATNTSLKVSFLMTWRRR